ncbi:MAG: NUDIX hydrolase [Hymenobacter sp.]|nr:MAG: NUDIX hydrolase [Hymenobacter sp.]
MQAMTIIQRRRAFDGHFKVTELTLHTADGENLPRERFEPGHAVAALVFDTTKQQYVLTRQFRIGPEAELTEIAAGMIDRDENPETAIRRELHEELGYEVDALTEIVKMWPSPGTSAETIVVYYAEVSRQTGAGGGLAAEHEQIEFVCLSRAELIAEPWQDAKTLLAVQWVQLNK